MRATRENRLLVGEAEVALRELQARHRREVEVALLDPPYNTASRFHHYDDRRDRASWLADRRRELELLHPLLSPTGSVWVHLDDSEMHYAKVMMDEVFGPAQFVGTIVWQKSLSRENRTDLSATHAYLLVYARERRAWRARRNLLPLGEEQLSRYANPDGDPRGPWTSGDMTAKAGPGRRAAQFYDVTTPSGRVVRPAHGMAWRFTRERFDALVADGRVSFGPGEDNMPRLKRFLGETRQGLVPTTWWPAAEVGTTDSAKKGLRRQFPDLVPFETPKPEELAERVLAIASDPGDLVLDYFAGSGTTPAVAHRLGRRWIAVERERRTVREFAVPRLDRVVAECGGDYTATLPGVALAAAA